MIFSTQNQINYFAIFLLFGLLIGLFFKLFNLLFLIKFKKIFQKNIFFSVFYSFFCVFFAFLLIFFNFGKFSFTLFLSYLLGFLWALKVLKKSFDVFENLWYNTIKKINSKHKSKEELTPNEISIKS